jgi:hypothetical protein
MLAIGILATPFPGLAAMVYGSVANCRGDIQVWSGSTQVAVVPVKNQSYEVVLPPGSYRVRCTDNDRERTIRSDPSPLRQNLNF